MKCLMILAVLVAAVATAPQYVAYSAPFPYTAANTFAYAGAPVAYAAPAPVAYAAAAPVAYAAAAPVAYAAPAPVAYTAPVAPVAYQTGAKVVAKYEPVEQHGYSIAY